MAGDVILVHEGQRGGARAVEVLVDAGAGGADLAAVAVPAKKGMRFGSVCENLKRV